MKHEHRSPRMALLLALAAGWPLSALAAAGLVQFSAGDVQMRRGEVLSALARGASVEGGDVVLTGTTGRAQIRFTDGGVVSLFPGSQFMVERYVDSGDPEVDKDQKDDWRGWTCETTGGRNECDYEGTRSFAQIACQSFFSQVQDGDILHLPLLDGRLQTWESHHLRNPWGHRPSGMSSPAVWPLSTK